MPFNCALFMAPRYSFPLSFDFFKIIYFQTFLFSVDHRVVLSLEVADFGQLSSSGNPTFDVASGNPALDVTSGNPAFDVTSGNPALDAKLHWTDRLQLSTECHGNDISFFVEIFVDAEESIRLCLQRNLVRTKRQMVDNNSTKTMMTQQVYSVSKKNDFYAETSKNDFYAETSKNDAVVESENDVIKSSNLKSFKSRKNDRIKFSVELVTFFQKLLDCN